MIAVILSAALHACWNLLLRRAGGNNIVAAMCIVAEALILLPPALVVFYSSGTPLPGVFLPVVLVAAALALANYAALIAAYAKADLSLVYPVARGGVFLFLPLLGFLVFGERLGAAGWLALAMIVAGITMLPLARLDRASFLDLGRHLRERWMVFALLAAASTAAYTVWDKYAIGFINTFLYFAAYTVLLGIWFGVVLARAPRDAVRDGWRRHRASIAIAGVFIASSYLLLLVALRDGVSTQVLAVRQLSIPIGVLLGWQFLRESLSPPRVIGSALITGGCVLAALM